jgi:hypothetical protein
MIAVVVPLNQALAAEQPETLKGVEITSHDVIVQVASGGCTDKKSFKVKVHRDSAGSAPAYLAFLRVKSDVCKESLANGVKLAFSKSELGLDGAGHFVITNPFDNSVSAQADSEKNNKSLQSTDYYFDPGAEGGGGGFPCGMSGGPKC